MIADWQKTLWPMVLALLPAAAHSAVEADSPWYIGAKVSSLSASGACEAQATSCDTGSVGGGLFVGYVMNDWLAFEAGYDVLDDITAEYPAILYPNSTATYVAQTWGVEFAAKPYWQVNEQFSLFAKVGTFFWDMGVTGQEVNFTHNADESGWSPLLGVGGGYAFNKSWSVALEYQHIANVGGSSTGGADFNMINFSVAYRLFTFDFGQSDAEPSPPPAIPFPVVAQSAPQVESSGGNEYVAPWLFTNAHFSSNSTALAPEFQLALQPWVKRMISNPQTRLMIHAHTDDQGDEKANMALSLRRADAVRNYLISQGVNPAQMEAQGFGETDPIADNGTEEGRRQNRRVELLAH